MAVKELTLGSLMNQLDGGRISEAFMAELRRVGADMDDRPGDDKERTVVLTLKLKPVIDDGGDCESVNGSFHVASTVPKRRSKNYNFGIRNRGAQLVFNDMSEDNVQQRTIDELAGEDGE